MVAIETLSKNQTIGDKYLNSSSQIVHTQYSRDCELIVVAPATANFIAKLANGICDDTLTNLCAARNTEMLVVPAMNIRMWENPANQRNINLLKKDNISIFGPAEGMQACGDSGVGRMKEPGEIAEKILDEISFTATDRSGEKIVINKAYIEKNLDNLVKDTDLSKFIL
mgnify:CR=1 FL=1